MGSLNRVILVGTLGKDAELRHTPGGAAVSTMSVATDESWTDKDGSRKSKTEWHRVTLWGKSAENLAEYLVKGKSVAIEGRLETRKWEDKDGQTRYTTEIKADKIQLLGGKGRESYEDEHDQRRPARRAVAESAEPIADDDIPF